MPVITVDTEACFSSRSWTGVESSFATDFKAEATGDVLVYSRDDTTGAEALLTQDIHYSVSLAGDGAVTVTPIALPTAPKTLLIVRNTSALQGTEFANLGNFAPALHTTLHSRAAMRDAEDKMHRNRTCKVPLGFTAPADGIVALRDGITAPAAVAGLAIIYVDVADGDLKVKFADGTVKTIATDT